MWLDFDSYQLAFESNCVLFHPWKNISKNVSKVRKRTVVSSSKINFLSNLLDSPIQNIIQFKSSEMFIWFFSIVWLGSTVIPNRTRTNIKYSSKNMNKKLNMKILIRTVCSSVHRDRT